MGSRFFTPAKGEKYEEGINGKKILVVGASFYCNKNGKNGQKQPRQTCTKYNRKALKTLTVQGKLCKI